MTFIHTEIFGGVPFAEEAFQPAVLLAAVRVVRQRQADRAAIWISHPDELFDPAVAAEVRQSHVQQPVPNTDLTLAQEAAVDDVLSNLRDLFPEWTPLLDIPMHFRHLVDSAAISASSFAWPQHIFLGEEAFEDDNQLSEQIVHEFCHCWLYFMDEVAPIGSTERGRDFVLPSGTSNRDAAEVLGALHVAVTLQRLWIRLDVGEEQRNRRISALQSYAAGCSDLLRDGIGLTAGGESLARRLHGQVTSRSEVAVR